MSNLVINVLAEENAIQLKKHIFGNKVKIVKGSYTGTYGLYLPFDEWFKIESQTVNFLYGEKVKEMIGMDAKDLLYYEFLDDGKTYEEVDFSELFPYSGFYRFDPGKVIQVETSTERIFYKGHSYCRLIANNYTIADWITVNKDPLIVSGLSKIFRRGFLKDSEKEIWKQTLRLKDILVY